MRFCRPICHRIAHILRVLGIRPDFLNRAQMISRLIIYSNMNSWIRLWPFWKIVWDGRFNCPRKMYRPKSTCPFPTRIMMRSSHTQRINSRYGSRHTVNEIAAARFPLDHRAKTVWAKRRNSEWPLAVFPEHLPPILTQTRHGYWDVVQKPLSPNWGRPVRA